MTTMTKKARYLQAGLELMPSGRVNSYQLERMLGAWLAQGSDVDAR